LSSSTCLRIVVKGEEHIPGYISHENMIRSLGSGLVFLHMDFKFPVEPFAIYFLALQGEGAMSSTK
jgi:hypothetical protein